MISAVIRLKKDHAAAFHARLSTAPSVDRHAGMPHKYRT